MSSILRRLSAVGAIAAVALLAAACGGESNSGTTASGGTAAGSGTTASSATTGNSSTAARSTAGSGTTASSGTTGNSGAAAGSGTAAGSATAAGSGTASSTTKSTAPSATTSKPAPATVIGRSTSVIVNPAITAALRHAGITVTALAPASSKNPNTVFIFPATGGQVVTATVIGTVYNLGGLTLNHAGKGVRVTSLIVNTGTKQLVAQVGRKQVAAFDLNLASLKRASGPNGTVVASAIELTTTPQLARSLNSALGVDTFKGGQNFGTTTLTIAVKH